MIKVVNVKKEKCDVYVGRPSVLGNVFVIGKDGNREQVIEKYKEYFIENVNKQGEFRNEVINIYRESKKGNEVKLGCYCAPLACHADVIKVFIENFLEV